MLTERDYREVLQELGFADPLQPNTSYFTGRALRHGVRRFNVPGRQEAARDAFWPTLYWNSNGDYNYFSTPARDSAHFGALFWVPADPDQIHEEHRDQFCVVPRHDSRLGLRIALESLFLAVPEWLD